MKKKWLSSRPELCDICDCSIEEEEFFIDGRTKFGPWGIMCPSCHESIGFGLGIGNGQMYSVETLEKVEEQSEEL